MIWEHSFKIDSWQRPTMRSSAFLVSLKVMVASAVYVNGSFQAGVGDVHNISRPSDYKI